MQARRYMPVNISNNKNNARAANIAANATDTRNTKSMMNGDSSRNGANTQDSKWATYFDNEHASNKQGSQVYLIGESSEYVVARWDRAQSRNYTDWDVTRLFGPVQQLYGGAKSVLVIITSNGAVDGVCYLSANGRSAPDYSLRFKPSQQAHVLILPAWGAVTQVTTHKDLSTMADHVNFANRKWSSLAAAKYRVCYME